MVALGGIQIYPTKRLISVVSAQLFPCCTPQEVLTSGIQFFICGHPNIGLFQKTSIPPPRRELEVNPPTPFGCPNTFTIIRNNFSPLPLWTAEISSVGGVWIFSGTYFIKNYQYKEIKNYLSAFHNPEEKIMKENDLHLNDFSPILVF